MPRFVSIPPATFYQCELGYKPLDLGLRQWDQEYNMGNNV